MDSSLEDRKESKKGKSVSFKLFEKKDFQVSNYLNSKWIYNPQQKNLGRLKMKALISTTFK